MYHKFFKDRDNHTKKKTKLDKRRGKIKTRKITHPKFKLKSTQTWFQRKNKYRNEGEVQIMN
jgi:hypothetical protein